MDAFAIIGFWAAVIGGVLMYMVAGREVAEALRELFRKPVVAASADAAKASRLGRLATALFGQPIAVALGPGVTLDGTSGRAVCIGVPDGAESEAVRHVAIQAGRLRAGAYRRSSAITRPELADRYRRTLDAALVKELVREMPGAPWTSEDRALAELGAQLRSGNDSSTPLPACDVPWRVEVLQAEGEAASKRSIRKVESLARDQKLHPKSPERLTEESEAERQGIFFIRFESIQEWTEDYLDLDRPSEDDGDAEGLQSTGAITRKATTSTRGSHKRSAPAGPLADDEMSLPEWDGERNAYKPGYCRAKITPGWLPESDAAWTEMRDRLAKPVKQLERQLELLTFHHRRERRSANGREIDLAAWVRFRGDLAAGASCDATRLYQTLRAARRPLTVGTLVDLSASTETPCGERRVVDVERDAVYLLSKAIDSLGDAHAAWGFTSQGASQVELFQLKGFEEPIAIAEKRLAGLGPYANTRMGAAIRRALPELCRRGGKGRLLFVLTDGKPHDDDGYAGEYAYADTRRAIEEARAQGVRVVGIGIGPDAQDGVRSLFAPYFVSVERIDALPKVLASVYLRVASQGART